MHNHYAPPQVYAPYVAVASHAGLQNAPLDRRFFGAFIDGLILFVVGSFVSVASAAAFGVARTPNWAFACMFVPQLVNWYLTATRGQSLGKILVKTRIVRMDETAPGFLHGVVLRAWPFLVPGIVLRFVAGDPKDFLHMLPSLLAMLDVAFIFAAGARCFHDRVAGTRVVDLRVFGSAYGRARS
jgi:uncharacterized RDD family membrane protein YckC